MSKNKNLKDLHSFWGHE